MGTETPKEHSSEKSPRNTRRRKTAKEMIETARAAAGPRL